jgi:hypothetical protein
MEFTSSTNKGESMKVGEFSKLKGVFWSSATHYQDVSFAVSFIVKQFLSFLKDDQVLKLRSENCLHIEVKRFVLRWEY